MATYVVSDLHGHLNAFDRALSRISLGAEDTIYVIGDMVDRGPDPVGVLRLVRSLPNAVALMGNHEAMMLDSIVDTSDAYQWLLWSQNGGMVTAEGLASLTSESYAELVRWVRSLRYFEIVEVALRPYILVHAGFCPLPRPAGGWTRELVEMALSSQAPDDLIWIRDEFYAVNTGMVDETGAGFITISGHTPTVVAELKANICDRPARNDDGLLQMVYLGSCPETNGIPDRIAIDCGAGSVPGFGRIGILRLDDLEEFYEPVYEGE